MQALEVCNKCDEKLCADCFKLQEKYGGTYNISGFRRRAELVGKSSGVVEKVVVGGTITDK